MLIGVDFKVLAGILPIVGLWAVFLHANVRWTFGPLRWVIATPHFHRWHHSRAPEARDKNFAALFPIWDVLFGTLYLPDHQPDAFGVDTAEEVPSGFFGQILYPFRRANRRINIAEPVQIDAPRPGIPRTVCKESAEALALRRFRGPGKTSPGLALSTGVSR